MDAPLYYLSLSETQALLQSRELTAEELVKSYLQRIGQLDGKLHAYITVDDEQALEQAARIDALRKEGEPLGSLAGIPLAVKDSIPTQGIRTTANSRLLADWMPEKDAAPVAALKQAGAIILGKTNLNEFGWSVPSDDDLAPVPCNPWNTELAAIGSSSGSGVATAAGMCCGSLGTDGGGSTRLPASQMNLIGIKPTHGLVSRLGMDNSSISEICPLARTTKDAALLLEVMARYEPDDVQSWPLPAPVYASHLESSVKGWQVGMPRRYIESAPVAPEILSAFEEGLRELARLGLQIVDVEVPGLAEARVANFIILNAEAYAEHVASLRKYPEKYGRSAYLYHLTGAFLSAADLQHAREFARRMRHILEGVLQEMRLLALPTSVHVSSEAARRPEAHHSGLGAAFTSPFNATGHPAISIPCGLSSLGLPVGMQLVGRLYAEMDLFQVSYAYEQATRWHILHPGLDTGVLSAS